MNILINFSAQKIGGGQNVALNFVNCILQNPQRTKDDLFFVVAKDSILDKILTNSSFADRLIRTSNNPIIRSIHELLFSNIYLKKFNIDIIYSYFGWGFFSSKYPQVSGAAASYLFYPELDFWKNYKGFSRLKNRLTDRFRIYGLRKANGVIFETTLLETRFHELFHTGAITKTIKPSISVIHNNDNTLLLCKGDKKLGLFLCGWQLNKGILLIPEIAAELKTRHIPFIFVITASVDSSVECACFIEKMKRFGVEDYIRIIGSVDKSQLESLYNQADLVFLLSKIESFSNNIIESWTFRCPLIVADEPWARNICKNAAIYVNRDSVMDISDVIEANVQGQTFEVTINNGINLLKTYPTIEERTEEELSFVKQVYTYAKTHSSQVMSGGGYRLNSNLPELKTALS